MPRAQYPSKEALSAAAVALSCEGAMVRAVARVESSGFGAFIDSLPGEPPVILFERHKFSELTGGRFDGARVAELPETCSLISYPQRGGYGLMRQQHARLEAARLLDADAAVMSASWGLWQLMGFNWRRCGAKSLRDFESAMRLSVDSHLAAFVSFIWSDARLAAAMKNRAFRTIALLFNGADYERDGYHIKLESAYNEEKEEERCS